MLLVPFHRLAISAALFVPLTLASAACAENFQKAREPVESQSVVVEVRVLRASGTLDAATVRTVAQDSSYKRVYDSHILDLKPVLSRLHYSNFRFVSAQKKVLQILDRETMPFSDGHTLAVQPLSIDNQTIGIKLRWEEHGVPVLITRKRFNPGETMLAVTDQTPDAATILAIAVSPYSAAK